LTPIHPDAILESVEANRAADADDLQSPCPGAIASHCGAIATYQRLATRLRVEGL